MNWNIVVSIVLIAALSACAVIEMAAGKRVKALVLALIALANLILLLPRVL